jgi:hypothetical protein
VKEPGADLLFQPPDRFGKRGLRHTFRVGAGREASMVDDCEDVFNLAQLHR